MFNSKGGFLNQDQSNSRFPEKKQYNSILIPATIKMLLDCLKNIEDDVLTIDSVKFEYVSVCGRIEDVNEETSRTVIKFSDCTGTIKCFIPSKSGEPPSFLSKISLSPGLLVKLVLSLTPFQDRRIFICQRLEEIKNYNEISHHLLTTMQSHLKRTSEKYRASLIDGRSNKENSLKNENQFKRKDIIGKGPEPKVSQVCWEEKAKGVIVRGGGGEEEKLFEVVKIINENAPESSTFEVIAKIWTGKMDAKKLRFLLGKLTQDGYIYTSGDKYRTVE